MNDDETGRGREGKRGMANGSRRKQGRDES